MKVSRATKMMVQGNCIFEMIEGMWLEGKAMKGSGGGSLWAIEARVDWLEGQVGFFG